MPTLPVPHEEPTLAPAMPIEGPLAPPDAEAIRSQLARVVRSQPFVRSSRIVEFLTFVVENTVEGNHDVLKETCIGAAVFGRDPAYDTKIDPIVRVEARRLRSKLQEYYEGEGVSDAVLITLPKGSYRPLIEARALPSFAAADPEPLSMPARFPSETAADPLSSPLAGRSRRLPLLGFAAVNLVAVLAVALAWLRPWQDTARQARVAPLTSLIGQEFDPALSPDGRHLAFVWDGDHGNYHLYVQPLKGGEPTRLTDSTAHDLHPAWSPDGRDLAFLRVTPERSEVMTVSAGGGPERSLGEVHSTVSVWKADALQMFGDLGPTWMPDGSSLVVDDNGALFLWPLAFGAHHQITHPPTNSNDFYPAVSPDGTQVAFVRQTSNSTADLFLAPLGGNGTQNDTQEPRRLTNDRSDIRGATWSPDGRSLVFASARQGNYSLWRVFLDNGRIESLPIHSTQAVGPSLSRTGDLLVYTETRQNTNIWRLELGKRSRDAAPTRLIASSGHNNSAQFAPDGSRIAFISDRSGTWELWVSAADGSAPRQITGFHGPLLGSPHWSPDGRSIAFDARPGEHSALFVVSSTGGEPRQLSRNGFEERMPSWSADGRFLYFNSTRSGAVRLWKMPAVGGEAVQITDRPAYDSFEAHDGRWVYFRSDGPGLWRVASSGGPSEPVPALANIEPSRYLAVVGYTLYFVDREDTPRSLMAYSFGTGRLSRLGTLDHLLVSGTPSLSVSPDGQFAIYAQQDQSESDVFGVPWKSVR